MNTTMRRIFFGLEIPARIKDCLLTVRSNIPGARWQRPEQMHITLQFLGDLEEQRLASVCEAARDIPVAAFNLDVVGLGCFGKPESPRNLWAGVQPKVPVASLHSVIKDRMEELGLATESRPFHPHITLARFRPQAASVQHVLNGQDRTAFGSFLVSQFVLFDSALHPDGSVYTVIERFSLRPYASASV